MKHVELKNNWPAYAQGPFAPGEISFKICPCCGRRIRFLDDKCKECGAERANNWKPIDLAKEEKKVEEVVNPVEMKKEELKYDLEVSFTSIGGDFFEKGTVVNVYGKNGCIAFKAGNVGRFVKLDKDFFMCARRDSVIGKTVNLVFSDFLINMKDNATAEKIMVYIYSSILNRVYEKRNTFFNADHELFPL